MSTSSDNDENENEIEEERRRSQERWSDILLEAVNRGDVETIQSVLESGVDVNESLSDSLIPACEHGFLEIVRILLDAGADPKWRDCNCCSAMLEACASGHLSIAELLFDRDSSLLEIDDFDGHTPLLAAVANGHSEIVRFLLGRGANARAVNQYGVGALMEACDNGSLEIVKLVMDAGVYLDERDGSELTALHYAAGSGHGEIVQFLMDRGANVFATTTGGGTTLMYACENSNIEIIRLLVAAGVDVDARDRNHDTALIRAARRGTREAIHELILRHNANVFLEDKRGNTPFDLACQMERYDTAHSLLEVYGSQMEQVSGHLALHVHLRLAKYSYPSDDEYRPPLISPLQIRLAFGTLTLEHWRFFLQHLDVELILNRDISGKLPIHIACQFNAPVEILATLVELDSATLQIADHTGALPLHERCRGNIDFSSVRYLVEQGGVGTLAARDRQGLLPLHVLCGSANKSLRTVQYLIQSFPMSVSMQTNAGEYPFMMAACEPSPASLSVVYELVRASPALVIPR